MIERYRDVIIIYEDKNAYVVSCDSTGSIGNKPNDRIKVDEEIVGRSSVRVALSEALSVGAKPVIISDTLSNEMSPTGEKIIKGIKDELDENGFFNVLLTGSTEENFETSMTAVGITVVAKAKKEDLKIKKVLSGMDIALMGYPRVGLEVLTSDDVLTLKDYMSICDCCEIVEAVPVGSKGIKYELKVLEEITGLKVKNQYQESLDVYKSGGPSTCCIVVYKKINTHDIANLLYNKPFTYIGFFE
ncbi:MAG: AIR synthase related protein [Thermoanaerobacteraceae bacterium]|nr:AIR synthase related protein [Thermoanaerobacteraceae bacterium]